MLSSIFLLRSPRQSTADRADKPSVFPSSCRTTVSGTSVLAAAATRRSQTEVLRVESWGRFGDFCVLSRSVYRCFLCPGVCEMVGRAASRLSLTNIDVIQTKEAFFLLSCDLREKKRGDQKSRLASWKNNQPTRGPESPWLRQSILGSLWYPA